MGKRALQLQRTTRRHIRREPRSSFEGSPKQLWSVDEDGQAFEAIHGESKPRSYHGYPIRHADPFSDLFVRSTLVNKGKLDRWRTTPRG